MTVFAGGAIVSGRMVGAAEWASAMALSVEGSTLATRLRTDSAMIQLQGAIGDESRHRPTYCHFLDADFWQGGRRIAINMPRRGHISHVDGWMLGVWNEPEPDEPEPPTRHD